ncbi:MAG TPA: hypothetical protein VGO07_06275 [Candidatus Saccharimonadales bacterium]|jgi:hypothetical protein|nr:hypothetical protein [Candidatus Saccharimonadales bacterium]
MAEISTPIPIQVTARVEAQAAREDIRAFDVDPTEFTAVLNDTGRTDITPDTAAYTIGASKPFGGDSPQGPLFEGGYIGSRKPEPAQPGSIGQDRHVIHLQVDHTKPITEVDLAQRTAETLLVPARMRNTVRRALGGLSLAAGGLVEVVAFAKYWADNGEFTPGTLAWMTSGAIAMVGGGVAIANGHKRARQINTAEQRAAARTPIKIQR